MGCTKGLKQFQKEGIFVNSKGNFSCDIDHFMNHAEFIKKLGQGSFGTVDAFKFNGRTFAVKTCKEIVDFQREERALTAISKDPHPCVIHVFLWGHTGSGLKAGLRLVMERTRTDLE